VTDTVTIVEADLNNPVHLDDLLFVLESYKLDGMGEGLPYTEGEKALLRRQFIVNPSVLVFLVYRGNILAGGSVCFKTFSTFTTGNVLNIHDICILRKYRGSGLGRELMKCIIGKGRELLCSKITLEVREDNAVAQNLYNSLDFGESRPVMHFWNKKL
jgi:ribosomal protein S18 acetylase RimI-like enzyme